MQKVEGTNSHSFKNEILGLLWQVWSEVVRLISRDYVYTINPFSPIAVVSGTHGAMVDSRPRRRIPPHQMLSGRHPRSAGLCLNGNGFTPRGSKIGQIEKLVQV